jgi:hypothetical protein
LKGAPCPFVVDLTVGLPVDVFADVTPKIVMAWRGRAAVESPSHLRDHLIDVALTLLSALLYCREREITDTLVNLLCSTVHRIGCCPALKMTTTPSLLMKMKMVALVATLTASSPR